MADYGAAVEAFQRGADWRQRYRANKQFEQARDQALERGGRTLFDERTNAEVGAGNIKDEFGVDTPLYQHEGLQDPFAYRLIDWFKQRRAKKKAKTQALDLGGNGAYETSNPVGMGGDTSMPMEDPNPGAEPYADGGEVTDEEKIKRAEKLNRQQERNARVEIGKEKIKQIPGKVKEAASKADDAVGKFTGRAAPNAGRLAKVGGALKRGGAAGALLGTAMTAGTTDTDEYRKRFGLELGPDEDPNFLGELGIRTLGAASDLGDALTFGGASNFYRDKQGGEAPEQAAPRQAIPFDSASADGSGGGSMSASQTSVSRGPRPSPVAAPEPEIIDFNDVDIDATEVPNMQVNDWKKYRMQALQSAARKGIDPVTAQEQVNDQITRMQIKGFMGYGQQGLALQQAGNLKGAMAAYRAAFQYFPNGNDVDFGLHKGRDGRAQIVGVGRNEETGEIVPGSQLVMDPERVATLLENFQNPSAFRAWTKDWRGDQFRERTYQEVTKPMAQAQADYMATNADANMVRAENAQLRAGGAGGAGSGANMRNAENVFRERLGEMGMTDPSKADYLASIMSQVKAKNPQVPDNSIVHAVMTADRDGTLAERLQKMGVGGAPAAAPRQAIPLPSDEEAPEMAGLSEEEKRWAMTPAQ